MEKEYWEDYYKLQNLTSKPSLFADFVLNNFINKGSSLIELGCGNGRDAVFFANNGIGVLAVDQCEEEIFSLSKNNSNDNLKFLFADFTRLEDIGIFDNIYSRFTLHSINEAEEDRVFKWSFDHLNTWGKLLIETRGQKNELFKLGNLVDGETSAFVYENHYRRFVDLETVCKKLIASGFDVILSEEKSGFAPFNGTDYIFARIVAMKK